MLIHFVPHRIYSIKKSNIFFKKQIAKTRTLFNASSIFHTEFSLKIILGLSHLKIDFKTINYSIN